MVLDLIKFIIESFAEKPEDIKYLVEENGNNVNVTVVLDDSDMGKVIGRQGKLAKALRVIVRTAALKEGKKYNIDIKETSEIN